MSASRRSIVALAVISMLLLIDIGLHLYRVYEFKTDPFMQRFTVVHVQTNDTKATMILDRKTHKPVWGTWDFGQGGHPDSVSYFYEGRNIMNIYPLIGEPPRLDVTFYGEDGKVKAVWGNRGTNVGFTERERYDVSIPRREIWFNESWHALQYRTNDGVIRGGIVLDGKWQHVTFTNGHTVIEP